MSPSSITRRLSRALGCAALLALVTAATCEGAAKVQVDPFRQAGDCSVIIAFDHQSPGTFGDVLQVADANNVNDFIRCHLVKIDSVSFDAGVIVGVSIADTPGHRFVADSTGQGGAPAIVVNLSQ